MSDTRVTVGDLDELLVGDFDGTEYVEVYPTSDGVSKRTAADTLHHANSDTSWTTTTSLENGWTGTVRYIKRAGMVTVVIDDLDETSSSLAAAIELPAAYRPATTMRGSITKSGTTTSGRLNVTTDGLVQVLELNGSGIFGSITYPVL